MAEPAPAAVSESRSQPSPGLARVLVVEDDARMRRVLELLLSEHWTVEAVADARGDLDLDGFGVALMDLVGVAVGVGVLEGRPRTTTVPLMPAWIEQW